MTENSHTAEIDLQVNNCRLRVCGDVNFVSAKFQELSDKFLTQRRDIINTTNRIDVNAVNENAPSITDLYSIDSESGKVSIHGKIPGSSKSERMKNVALVVLYCKDTDNPVPSAEIKEVCITQACLDSSNFATAIKKDNTNFIIAVRGTNGVQN